MQTELRERRRRGEARRSEQEEASRLTEEPGDGGRRRGRWAGSEGAEGSEETRRLRWRLNQLEKDKLELTSRHNQELCRLQAELTQLRSTVERGEAQREELQYQLTVSQRDSAHTAVLSREKLALTERAAELAQTVQELQTVVDITRQAREEDQHALQQEVEERDKLIQSLTSENQQLHLLLQEQEEAVEESERRMAEVQKERQKEAEVIGRQADKEKYLMEREERSRREKEVCDQRVRELECSIEGERAAHLGSKFNSEVIQLRVRDLEAAVASERAAQRDAASSLELLRTRFREVERLYGLERERGVGLRAECEQCKSDLSLAWDTERKTTSDLEEEKKRHRDTQSRMEQAVKAHGEAEELHVNYVQKIRETLQHHSLPGCSASAVHDGSPSAEVSQLLRTTLGWSRQRREGAELQLQDLLLASETLQEENRALLQLTSEQTAHLQESREEVRRLHRESCDRSTQSRGLRAELQREREERASEVQKTTDLYREESEARLSFLYCLYQRLSRPHCILGHFSWQELCEVIVQQVERVTSDLQRAKEKIARLQEACEKKSVCLRALSRREAELRRREESWSQRLQVARSQRDSLRQRASSLTSDLSLRRREAESSLSACALLGGALRHAHRRLQTLSQQKDFLRGCLTGREELEEELRRLADALGGAEGEGGARAARRRWRRSVWVVLAVRRWRALAENTTVFIRVERADGAPAVCVDSDTTTHNGHTTGDDDDDDEGVRAGWLRSERLSATILSSMSDLQGALSHTGSAPPDLTSAARLGLSRLLDHLLVQSDAASCRGEEHRARPDVKALVSTLQQHFLLFSRRLHSAEVERRSLRLEVANLKRGAGREPEDTSRTVPCVELRQAQALIQEQKERHCVTTQALSETQLRLSRKDRALRILGKHLSGVHRGRKELEERLRRAEDELRDATRDFLMRSSKAAEANAHTRSEEEEPKPAGSLGSSHHIPTPSPPVSTKENKPTKRR